jgi:glutamyl-tRNA reductase
VSVARVGVQLARRVFDDLQDKRVLLIGAGETAEAALLGLRDAGVRAFTVANRTLESARSLAARFGGRAIALDQLAEELPGADVVIASVQVDRPLLGRAELERAQQRRAGRPALVIDLGVPRNIDPAANELADVYTFDLDDIEAEAERGRAQRAGALPEALRIVSAEVDAYERWRASLPLVPTIRRLRERIEAQVREELAKAGSNGPDAERVADAIAGRILHEPLLRLHREAEEGSGEYYADCVQALFALEEGEV